MSFTFSHRGGVWASEYLPSLFSLGGESPLAASEVNLVEGSLSRGTTLTLTLSSKGALPSNEGVVSNAGSGWA